MLLIAIYLIIRSNQLIIRIIINIKIKKMKSSLSQFSWIKLMKNQRRNLINKVFKFKVNEVKLELKSVERTVHGRCLVDRSCFICLSETTRMLLFAKSSLYFLSEFLVLLFQFLNVTFAVYYLFKQKLFILIESFKVDSKPLNIIV